MSSVPKKHHQCQKYVISAKKVINVKKMSSVPILTLGQMDWWLFHIYWWCFWYWWHFCFFKDNFMVSGDFSEIIEAKWLVLFEILIWSRNIKWVAIDTTSVCCCTDTNNQKLKLSIYVVSTSFCKMTSWCHNK